MFEKEIWQLGEWLRKPGTGRAPTCARQRKGWFKISAGAGKLFRNGAAPPRVRSLGGRFGEARKGGRPRKLSPTAPARPA